MSSAELLKVDLSAAEFLINHVVLPPQLPQDDDTNFKNEQILVQCAKGSIEDLQAQLVKDDFQSLEAAKKMLSHWNNIHRENNLDQAALEKALREMKHGDFLSVHVRAQNACILIHHDQPCSVCFHAFELSPANEDVMQTQGRLLRTFPGRSVRMPAEKFFDIEFRRNLSKTIELAHSESIKSFESKTTKGGSTVSELRGTTHPGVVTEYVMNVISACGEIERVYSIAKSTRDDVLWKNARLPWRRSPAWLALKVSLQISLRSTSDSVQPHKLYKNVILLMLCGLTKQIQKFNLSVDMLFSLCAKIARRLRKLNNFTEDFVTQRSIESIENIRNRLADRWKFAQDSEKAPLQPIALSDAVKTLQLQQSRVHIDKALARVASNVSLTKFDRSHSPRANLDPKRLPDLPSNAVTSEAILHLCDIETWVDLHVYDWASEDTRNTDDCTQLSGLLVSYTNKAMTLYGGCPRALSDAILTVMSLWHALDLVSVRLLPLLEKYSPEVPQEFLQPLLLPKFRHMQLAERIEAHICSRNSTCNPQNPSIFSDPCLSSFAVCYFDSPDNGAELRELQTIVENDARAEKKRKEEELQRLNALFNELTSSASNLEHGTYTIPYTGREHCKSNCAKCKKQKKAESLFMRLYEWPLPDTTKFVAAYKTVLFELKPPTAFIAWRDATWFILQHLGRKNKIKGSSPHLRHLSDYDPLSRHCQSTQRRLSLVSVTKSYLKSHYASLKISGNSKDVCVNNALKFRLAENSGSGTYYVEEQRSTPTVQRMCRYVLPDGTYKTLEWALVSTKHTSNKVMSRIYECPQNLSSSEFYEFTALRSGEAIQWYNILRALGSNSLSFNEDAVVLLILQAIWELGCPFPDDTRRVAHRVLRSDTFCETLYRTLLQRYKDVAASVKDTNTLYLVVAIASRALSLSDSERFRKDFTSLLRSARCTAIEWSRTISEQAAKDLGMESANQKRAWVVRSALVAISTFDVEDISSVLKENDDVSAYVEALARLHDNMATNQSSQFSALVKSQYLTCQKVARTLEPELRTKIEGCGSGIERPISRLWGTTGFSRSWKSLGNNCQRWVTNVTASERPVLVHLNVLSGELLLDGRPLSILPKEYRDNKLFRLLFDKRVIQVSASSMKGMLYMTTTGSPQEVHFGLDADRVVIRARINDRTLELMDPDIFKSDLPWAFVARRIPWLDLEAKKIFFCPPEDMWNCTDKIWTLSLCPSPQLRMGSKCVLDPANRAGSQITKILSVLERRNHIHATLNDEGLVEAELPRLGLNFFLDKAGLLESRELSAKVEPIQSAGCFIGLKSKLLVREMDRNQTSILVPFGSPNIKRDGHHVKVEIEPPIEQNIGYLKFRLDNHLCRLNDSNTLHEVLFGAYLHAITAFVLSDPFTGLSGTEQALLVLREQRTRTTGVLGSQTHDVLNLISGLTPQRSYYPSHLRVMQTVEWNSELSAYAQHEDFAKLAWEIVEQNSRFSIFHGSKPLNKLEGCNELHRRSKLRNSCFRRPSIAGEIPDESHDRRYEGRDRDGESVRGQRVHDFASLIRTRPSQLQLPLDLAAISSWTEVGGYGSLFRYSSLSKLFSTDLKSQWGALYDMCRTFSWQENREEYLFLFPGLVFDCPENQGLVKVLLAIAIRDDMKQLTAPGTGSFKLHLGFGPDDGHLRSLLQKGCQEFEALSSETLQDMEARQKMHNGDLEAQTADAAKSIKSQWPCAKPSTPSGSYSLLNLSGAMEAIRKKFSEWHRNFLYLKHLRDLQTRLEAVRKDQPDTFPLVKYTAIHADFKRPWHNLVPLLDSLLNQKMPFELPKPPQPLEFWRPRRTSAHPRECVELGKILDELELDSSGSDEYSKFYRNSLESFKTNPIPELPSELPCSLSTIAKHLAETQQHVKSVSMKLSLFLDNAEPGSYSAASRKALKLANLWPSLTPQTLLSLLNVREGSKNMKLKPHLIHYAEAIALQQRAERMSRFAKQGEISLFFQEAENPGQRGWDVREYPDWLILEIENNFRIREIQARVALELLSENGGKSAVMQMNMGQGKSSVIIPMIAAASASQRQFLTRVIVLRPLIAQTESLLGLRLGRLVGKPMYMMPFSRKTPVNATLVQNMRKIWEECIKHSGVFVTLPESILSFRLLGLERVSSDPALGKDLVDADSWLRKHCRDILDESDEILDFKFQLVYTVGNQLLVDGSPERWRVSQAVLGWVVRISQESASLFPKGLELQDINPSFPMPKFLNLETCDAILSRVLERIFSTGISDVSFITLSPGVRNAIREFVSKPEPSRNATDIVKNFFQESSKLNIIFLLRGLFALNILRHALYKRFHVEYGLHLSRCMMAVPYRAKGVPSQQSQFGHPDVAILLTCLSYYFTGLSPDQLRQAFHLLLKESYADEEYKSWSKTLPSEARERYRSIQSVDLDDSQKSEELIPHLRYSPEAVEYYLNRVVYPRESKEFEKKLSTSAWDIPSLEEHPRTVGFSGTNDNRSLLPLSIRQSDFPDLNHTNAMVLTILLKQQNRAYYCAVNKSGTNMRSTEFVSMVSRLRIDVIIDVGAQILDLSNKEVAILWLKEAVNAKAAVFFDDADVAQVIDREGRIDPLATSPFHEHLESCVVYLDEVHTRGIDLPLPAAHRAAIFLGPELQKDKLVQGCMRMRKLDCGQSLTFFAPLGVHQEIQGISGKGNNETLDSGDVVKWTLRQTQKNLDSARPLWFSNGFTFARIQEAKDSFMSPKPRIKELQMAIEEPETKTLKQMYDIDEDVLNPGKGLCGARSVVADLLCCWNNASKVTSLKNCRESEEQEREVACEVEQQHQPQKSPPTAEPLKHRLHQNVRNFAIKGTLPEQVDGGIDGAFQLLRKTSARKHVENTNFSNNVFVTGDFTNIFKLDKSGSASDLIRPVRWVISSKVSNAILIISPFEANELMSHIERSEITALHLYSPKVFKKMASFSDLQFHSISASTHIAPFPTRTLSILNLFSGTTYFDNMAQYISLCKYLGLVHDVIENESVFIEPDGFIKPNSRKLLGWGNSSPFQKSPLPLVKMILKLRGMMDSKTHIDKLLTGHPLTLKDFT